MPNDGPTRMSASNLILDAMFVDGIEMTKEVAA